jgi:hypothetical protein
LTTTSSLNNNQHHLNNNKQTIITKPFIAHQTIIKLQASQELNDNNSIAKCSNSEHSANYQLQQTAKNCCTTAGSNEQSMHTLLIDTTNSNLTDLNHTNKDNSLTQLTNNNQNSFRQPKGQTFMLAAEHIPTTFNQQSQLTHHSTNTTASTSAVVSNSEANGSQKTMLWTLVNSGSIVNSNLNILFATIPNTTGTNVNNLNAKQDNKLTTSTTTSQNGIVQCIKPTMLTNNNNKPITSATVLTASTPVLKYTTFVAPSSNLNTITNPNNNDSKNNVLNTNSTTATCITSPSNPPNVSNY